MSLPPQAKHTASRREEDMPGEPTVDVAILTVLPEEYKAVYDKLTDPHHVPSPTPGPNLYAWVLGRVPHRQSGASYSVALGMMGRAGTDPSALATADAITCWQPRYVFFVGIAGGFDLDGLQLGDVVVADLIYGYEYGKLEEVFLPRQNWVYRTDLALVNGATAFYTTHPDWTHSIQMDHPAKRTPKVFTGQVASGDKVVDDPTNEFFAQVRKAWPRLQAVEMEGAGAAVAIEHAQSKGLSVGFLMIRGVSDMPAPPDGGKKVRGTQERGFWKPYAAEAAAAFAVSFIAHGLPLPPRDAVRVSQLTPAAADADDSSEMSADPPSQPPPARPALQQLPGDRAPLGRGPGSPFVVGRPLRAHEPIFGRDEALRFLVGQLATFSSVNIVGERRMGKTSVLNHLVGRQEQLLIPQPDQPPLVLACLDLQAGITSDTRFYGAALREILDRLPPSRSAEARDFQEWRARLYAHPEMEYNEFQGALKRLCDVRGVCVRPVLIVDEFERLLGAKAQKEFPIPHFFDGLRALITADLLAMIVASRRSLADYFSDPARPGSLTSTFPSYFTPFTLSLLDDAAADALLLQPGDHPLTVTEAAEAKRWAGGHPCHLQVAGQAWYEARVEGRMPQWAQRRFTELKSQSCMTGPVAAAKTSPQPGWLRQILRAIFWGVPLRIGRLAQRLGARFDDVAAWIIGAAVIIVILLVLLGVATGSDLLDVIKKGLGL